MGRIMAAESPFYATLRTEDTLTVIGEIPIRIVFVEKRAGGAGSVGIAVDPPWSADCEFDAATKTLQRRLTAKPKIA